jgi:hypothetical protein
LQHSKRVWLLKKGLYGTKQGAKIWYETFTGHLTQHVGLTEHESDPCLFTNTDGNEKINSISSIYVDNAIIRGPDDVVDRIKSKIGERFAIKDLEIAKHVVGIQVEQLSEGTLLSQASYIDEIIEATGQKGGNIRHMPGH